MSLDTTDRERLRKLAELALHITAAEGEWRNAAVKFFSTLRRSNVKPNELLNGAERERIVYRDRVVYRDAPAPRTGKNQKVFRFGKYKDVPLDEIPFDYLLWALKTLKRLSPAFLRAIDLEIRSRVGTASDYGF